VAQCRYKEAPIGDVFSTGKSAAKRAQGRQEEQIAAQRQKEEARLAEETDEVARRKALAKSGTAGRRSLIRTSETGVGGRETLG